MELRRMQITYGEAFDSSISKESWGSRIYRLIENLREYRGNKFLAEIRMQLDYVQVDDKYALIVSDLSAVLYQKISIINT